MASEAARPFELRLPNRPERFEVASFRGREELSKLYRIELTVTTHSVDDGLAAALLGELATLTLSDAGRAVRAIHGRVARVEAHGLVSHGRQGLCLTLAPSFAALRRRRTRRIFQDQSTAEILAVLAAEHGVPCRAAVQRELPKRPYAVQYDETDYAFAARLLAEDGLFFFFEHPLDSDREVLVVGDRCEDYPPIQGHARLRFERAALAPTEDQVTSFVPRARVRSARVRVTGHDFRRPDAPLGDAAGADGTCAALDEHEGSYEDDLGPRPASIRLEEERARAVVVQGASFCRRLAPGHVFELAQHDYGWLDRCHVVTLVEHEGYGPELVPSGRATYQCRFEAAPANVVVRPRRRAMHPRQVAETAVVVGPEGQEIHTDALGRVKVRFHWENAPDAAHRGACWLRVMQPWAGAGWGAQFIPRVGMEVVVTFLGGDVDRPIVTGALYNATHPPAFPLPEQKTRSGLRSWSTPNGAGGNEISFEDAAGGEQLAVHARRDYDETVERNRTSRVRGARVEHVDGGSTTRVGADAYDEVMGRRTSRVHGDVELDLCGRVTRTIGGDEAVTVRGASTLTVEKGESVEVRGDRAVMVGTPEACAQSDHFVHGSASIGAAERLVLRAEGEIALVCGESSLVLTRDKIVLRAPTVEITPKETLACSTGKGPSLTLSDEVELLTRRFRMFTEAAPKTRPELLLDLPVLLPNTFESPRLADYCEAPAFFDRRFLYRFPGTIWDDGDTGVAYFDDAPMPDPPRILDE